MRLRLLLRALGWLLRMSSRTNEHLRSQLSRDLAFEVRSDDGVAYHYVVQDRRVRGFSGPASDPACTLRFATAQLAFACLTARDGAERIMRGLLDGTVSAEGSVQLLSWFQGLPQAVLPIVPPLRLAATPPDPYVAPDPRRAASRFITREPAAHALDPEWKGAADQRAKLHMMRAASGEPCPPY